MTMGLIQKTFLVLRPFNGALTCSFLIAGTQVILRKAYFLRRGSWLRPESWTPRPRIQNSGTYFASKNKKNTLQNLVGFEVSMIPISSELVTTFKAMEVNEGYGLANFQF
jgi:hypothetical protein